MPDQPSLVVTSHKIYFKMFVQYATRAMVTCQKHMQEYWGFNFKYLNELF